MHVAGAASYSSWGVHLVFCKGIKFEARPLDDDAPPLIVEIKTASCESSGYFHTLCVRAKPGSRDQFLNQYLVPLSSTQEAIDATYISDDVTVSFQMTVFPFHNFNLEGITELTDELPATAKKRICIVFIVPDHETTAKNYQRQTIVHPIGVDQDVLETTFQWPKTDCFRIPAVIGGICSAKGDFSSVFRVDLRLEQ